MTFRVSSWAAGGRNWGEAFFTSSLLAAPGGKRVSSAPKMNFVKTKTTSGRHQIRGRYSDRILTAVCFSPLIGHAGRLKARSPACLRLAINALAPHS